MNDNIIVLKLYDVGEPSVIYEKIIKGNPRAYQNIQKLEKLCGEYECFQDIEDFIIDNFEEVKYDEIVLEY